MTSLIIRPKHRADDAIADRDRRIDELAYDNEQLVCDLTRAVVRGCQDAMRIAQAEAERDAAVAEIRRLQQQTIRDAANLERLRQAVIAARPRITVVDTQLVRPYAPVVVLPYISAVPIDVAHDYESDPDDSTWGAA